MFGFYRCVYNAMSRFVCFVWCCAFVFSCHGLLCFVCAVNVEWVVSLNPVWNVLISVCVVFWGWYTVLFCFVCFCVLLYNGLLCVACGVFCVVLCCCVVCVVCVLRVFCFVFCFNMMCCAVSCRLVCAFFVS